MEVVQVQPRDTYLHYIYVPTKGTAIRWSFTTKRNNISFGLYRRRGQAPLPSSSDIIFHAQQRLQQRQLSAGELLPADGQLRKQHGELFFSLSAFLSRDTEGAGRLTLDSFVDDEHPEPEVAGNRMVGNGHGARPRAKSVASIKLKEQGLDEILPIQHMNSSQTKVEGSYRVEEPGNYVLVFGENILSDWNDKEGVGLNNSSAR